MYKIVCICLFIHGVAIAFSLRPENVELIVQILYAMIISSDSGFSEMVVRKLQTSESRTLKVPQNIGMEVRYK